MNAHTKAKNLVLLFGLATGLALSFAPHGTAFSVRAADTKTITGWDMLTMGGRYYRSWCDDSFDLVFEEETSTPTLVCGTDGSYAMCVGVGADFQIGDCVFTLLDGGFTPASEWDSEMDPAESEVASISWTVDGGAFQDLKVANYMGQGNAKNLVFTLAQGGNATKYTFYNESVEIGIDSLELTFKDGSLEDLVTMAPSGAYRVEGGAALTTTYQSTVEVTELPYYVVSGGAAEFYLGESSADITFFSSASVGAGTYNPNTLERTIRATVSSKGDQGSMSLAYSGATPLFEEGEYSIDAASAFDCTAQDGMLYRILPSDSPAEVAFIPEGLSLTLGKVAMFNSSPIRVGDVTYCADSSSLNDPTAVLDNTSGVLTFTAYEESTIYRSGEEFSYTASGGDATLQTSAEDGLALTEGSVSVHSGKVYYPGTAYSFEFNDGETHSVSKGDGVLETLLSFGQTAIVSGITVSGPSSMNSQTMVSLHSDGTVTVDHEATATLNTSESLMTRFQDGTPLTITNLDGSAIQVPFASSVYEYQAKLNVSIEVAGVSLSSFAGSSDDDESIISVASDGSRTATLAPSKAIHDLLSEYENTGDSALTLVLGKEGEVTTDDQTSSLTLHLAPSASASLGGNGTKLVGLKNNTPLSYDVVLGPKGVSFTNIEEQAGGDDPGVMSRRPYARLAEEALVLSLDGETFPIWDSLTTGTEVSLDYQGAVFADLQPDSILDFGSGATIQNKSASGNFAVGFASDGSLKSRGADGSIANDLIIPAGMSVAIGGTIYNADPEPITVSGSVLDLASAEIDDPNAVPTPDPAKEQEVEEKIEEEIEDITSDDKTVTSEDGEEVKVQEILTDQEDQDDLTDLEDHIRSMGSEVSELYALDEVDEPTKDAMLALIKEIAEQTVTVLVNRKQKVTAIDERETAVTPALSSLSYLQVFYENQLSSQGLKEDIDFASLETEEDVAPYIASFSTATSFSRSVSTYIVKTGQRVHECDGEEVKSEARATMTYLSATVFRDYDQEAADAKFVDDAYQAILKHLHGQALLLLEASYENALLDAGTTGKAEVDALYASEKAKIESVEDFESVMLSLLKDRYLEVLALRKEEGSISESEYRTLVDEASTDAGFHTVYRAIFRAYALQEGEPLVSLEDLTKEVRSSVQINYQPTVPEEDPDPAPAKQDVSPIAIIVPVVGVCMILGLFVGLAAIKGKEEAHG